MFNCDLCEETTRPGTKVHRVPEGYRQTRYPFRHKVFESSVQGKKKPVVRDDPGGEGFEIQGMLRACPSCYAEWEAHEALEVVPEGVNLPDAGASDREELAQAEAA